MGWIGGRRFGSLPPKAASQPPKKGVMSAQTRGTFAANLHFCCSGHHRKLPRKPVFRGRSTQFVFDGLDCQLQSMELALRQTLCRIRHRFHFQVILQNIRFYRAFVALLNFGAWCAYFFVFCQQPVSFCLLSFVIGSILFMHPYVPFIHRDIGYMLHKTYPHPAIPG